MKGSGENHAYLYTGKGILGLEILMKIQLNLMN